MTMGGGVVFWPWVECVVALFIYISAIITKAKMTRIGAIGQGYIRIIMKISVFKISET